MGPFLYSLEQRKWLGAPGEGLSVTVSSITYSGTPRGVLG